MIKKIIIALTLTISIFCMNLYAAVVTDNDGAAFITKAEYDSLKNTFQTQLDEDNQSLDAKIDNAISAYLRDINASKESENYYAKVKEAFGNLNPIFMNSQKTTKSTNKVEINLIVLNRYFIKSNILPDTDYELWSNGFTYKTAASDTTALYHPWHEHVQGTRAVPNAANSQINSANYNFYEANDLSPEIDSTTQVLTNRNIPYTSTMLSQQSWVGKTANCGSSIWNNDSLNPEEKYKGSHTTTKTQVGEGQAYVVHVTPAGNTVLREYASSIWPLCNGTITFHQYADYYAKNFTNWLMYHGTNGGMSINTTQTIDMPTFTDWGTVTKGSSKTDEATESAAWGDISIRLYKITDAVDYSIRLWGKTKNGTTPIKIYCMNNDVTPNASSASLTLSSSTFESYYYTTSIQKTIQVNNLPQNTVNYYTPSVDLRHLNLSDISNDTLTSLMGETVYMGNGVPIVKCNDDGTVRCKIKVATNNSAHNKVNVLVSDDKLDGGSVASGKTSVYSQELTVGTEYTFDINGKKDKIYWITLTNKDSGYEAWIDTFSSNDVK